MSAGIKRNNIETEMNKASYQRVRQFVMNHFWIGPGANRQPGLNFNMMTLLGHMATRATWPCTNVAPAPRAPSLFVKLRERFPTGVNDIWAGVNLLQDLADNGNKQAEIWVQKVRRIPYTDVDNEIPALRAYFSPGLLMPPP